MTEFRVNGVEWEWTILLDTFNNEILAHSVTSTKGSNKPYYHCLDVLKQLMDKREEQTSQVVFHTNQGAVYSSRAFCQAHKDYNILRSMSRVGTPTDNPIIEALNGWIKEELFLDLKKEFTNIIVTHNIGVAAYMADQLIVMQHGKVVDQGTRDEVMNHPTSDYTKKLLAAVPEMEGRRFV